MKRMPIMTNYKSGNVVLVEFIFSERIGSKRRPALVLSTDKYHNSRQELIIAAITSNVQRQLIGDTKLKDWKESGLRYPSLVTAIIQTIKKDMIRHRLGRLSKEDFQAVKANFKKALKL